MIPAARRTAVAVVAAVVTAVALAACAGPGVGGGGGAHPIDSARALHDAPAAVAATAADSGATSAAVTDCGDFELDQGERLPASATDCLAAAPARLAWSSVTSEGDPTPTFAFTRGSSGAVDVYSTSAFDSYGATDPSTGTTWTAVRCPSAKAATTYGTCTPL